MMEGVRRHSKICTIVATGSVAYDSQVHGEYVKLVDQIFSSAPFDVLAEFFPGFDSLDKFAVLNALDRIPTTILCGTADRLTSVGHSRKMHSLLPHSTLVACEGAGHKIGRAFVWGKGGSVRVDLGGRRIIKKKKKNSKK